MADSDESEHTKSPTAITADLELCKACGICAGLCPHGVFDRDELGRPIVARLEDCTSCLFCERHCPDFAIEIERRPRPHAAAAAAVPAVGPARGKRKAVS